MNSIQKLSLIVILLVSYGFTTETWGVPQYADITTVGINNYKYTYDQYGNPINNSLTRQVATADAFATALHSRINSKYPTTSTNWSAYYNADLVASDFKGRMTDITELVFFSGHGRENELIFWNFSTVTSADKQFKGYTKWVFFGSCLTMNTEIANIAKWFGGVHTIAGPASISWEYINYYDCYPWGCKHHRSEDMWADFAQRWVSNGETIWSAYRNAMVNTLWGNSVSMKGLRFKMAYIVGVTPEGVPFSGRNEVYSNSYSGPMYGNIYTLAVSLGTPQY